MDFVSLSSIFKQVPAKNDLQNLFIEPEEVRFLHYEETLFTDLREAIVLTIPLKNEAIQLEIVEVPISFYNYSVTTSDGQRFPANQQIKHYRGIVKDDPNSSVAISFWRMK